MVSSAMAGERFMVPESAANFLCGLSFEKKFWTSVVMSPT